MNFHIKVEMLVTVAVLYLAIGVSDGRVLKKCELGQDLNSTLPANLLAKIPNLVAKIVCFVNSSSQFNTSTITYVSAVPGSKGEQKCRSAEESSSEEDSQETIQVPNTGFSASTVKPVTSSQVNNPTSKNRMRRSVRSAKSSSEESSEENIRGPNNGFSSSTVKPVTQYLGNNVTSNNSVKARKGRSAESSSEESSGDDSNSSSSEERRKRSASGASSEESNGDDSNSSSSEERRKRSASGASSEESNGDDSNSSSSEERRKRSASGASSEESSEENIRGPKKGFSSSTVKPVTQYLGNNVTSSNSVKVRKGRSAESSSEESNGDDSSSSSSEERRKRSASGASSEESNGDDSNSSSSEERRKRSASGASSEDSSEENIQGPKLGFNSSTVKPVTKYQDSNVTRKYFRGRRQRSVESSSEESSGDDSDSSSSEERRRRSASKASSEESSEEDLPLNSLNSSTVTPVTRPPIKNSVSDKGVRKRLVRSAKSNTKKCNEKDMWTLYGLFQLPDRIACASGSEPSLNLCNLPCSSLLDDNIKDDITCFETILNKILSEEKQIGPNKEMLNKLRAYFFKKKCEKEKDSSFSTC